MKPYYAFFDVDGTILKDTTMLSFLQFFYEDKFKHKWQAKLAMQYFMCKQKIMLALRIKRERLNKLYYQTFKDVSPQQLTRLGKKWFKQAKLTFNPQVIEAIHHHQKNKGHIVFVSGSLMACLKPLADKLHVQDILTSQLEVRDKRLTGRLAGKPVIGEGKAHSIRDFLKRQNYKSLKDCYAYGDHDSDLPMLTMVGNPVVVSNNLILNKLAKKNGWQQLEIQNEVKHENQS